MEFNIMYADYVQDLNGKLDYQSDMLKENY